MNWYFVAIIAILAGECIIHAVVDWLNVRNIRTELPAEFAGFYDNSKYRKSQNYLRENSVFDIVSDLIRTVGIVLFILVGGFNLVDNVARAAGFGGIATGLLFVAFLSLISGILNIPFSVYETFIIEEKYGFNKTTVRTFILDIIKSWALGAIIGGPVLTAILWFFSATGEMAWLLCWAAVTVLQVILTFIAPAVIMPLFNKFTPLEEGALKAAIENYASVNGFRMSGIFTMDGSKRSGKSNAFFTGFGRYRRLVLLDTLVARHTVSELVSVVAHEMGHYRKHHVLLSMTISVCTTALMFFLMSLFINNAGLFAAFGMEHISVYASLLFFGFLYSPIMVFVSISVNALSRRWEYSADAYAMASCGDKEALVSALKKLSVDNLSNLTPHPVKVIMDYSHPPILERLNRITALQGQPAAD